MPVIENGVEGELTLLIVRLDSPVFLTVILDDAEVPTLIIPKSTDVGTTEIVGGNAPFPVNVTITEGVSGSFEDIVMLEEKSPMLVGVNLIVI